MQAETLRSSANISSAARYFEPLQWKAYGILVAVTCPKLVGFVRQTSKTWDVNLFSSTCLLPTFCSQMWPLFGTICMYCGSCSLGTQQNLPRYGYVTWDSLIYGHHLKILEVSGCMVCVVNFVVYPIYSLRFARVM